MKVLAYLALVLVIIGALNWGILGATGYNALHEACDEMFGGGSVTLEDGELDIDVPGPGRWNQYTLEQVVYIAVGVAGLFLIVRGIAKGGLF